MADGAVRDMGYRRFPAHLDTRHSDEGWWHGSERYSRTEPWYTFDRDRKRRDARRGDTGPPDDHQQPRAGDSPDERAAARRRASIREQHETWQRQLAAGEPSGVPDFVCECPPECAELDEGLRPVHAPDCRCLCDVD